jgi:hypothetical protein
MILTIAAVLLGALPAAQEGRLSTADGDSMPVRDLSLRVESGALQVSFTDAAGQSRSVRADGIVEISFGPERAAPARRPVEEDLEVILTTGDVLVGKAGAKSADGIQVLNPAFSDPTLKVDHIRAVLFPLNRAFLPGKLPDKVEADLVLMKSGDRAEGTLLSLSGSGVSYRSARFDREMNVPLGDVSGVWLTEIKAAPREPAGVFSVVYTADGSSVRGEIESLREGILTFKDLYGAVHRVAAARLSGLTMKNGRVVYLSELTPSSVREDANFIRGPQKLPGDLEYPFQRDRSARGTRIVLGGIEHRRGLGVRAHSELTYALGGTFRRFQSTVGLDAVAASLGLGAVSAEVWVDGKKLKESVFKAPDPPQSWDIDVAGARELRLVVTWAGTGQSDFADWGSARLIR